MSLQGRRRRTLNDLTGDLDVLLTGHEDEHVPWRVRQMDLEDLLDGAVDVVLARRLAVEDLDRERSSGDGERRGATGQSL